MLYTEIKLKLFEIKKGDNMKKKQIKIHPGVYLFDSKKGILKKIPTGYPEILEGKNQIPKLGGETDSMFFG